MKTFLLRRTSVHSLASFAMAVGCTAAPMTLLGGLTPVQAQSRSGNTEQRCAIGAGNRFRAVIPCSIASINNVLTITWQFAGRGVGTNVAAAGQWLGSQGLWRPCRGALTCLEAENGGFQIKATSCPLTLAMQPMELGSRVPVLPEGC